MILEPTDKRFERIVMSGITVDKASQPCRAYNLRGVPCDTPPEYALFHVTGLIEYRYCLAHAMMVADEISMQMFVQNGGTEFMK